MHHFNSTRECFDHLICITKSFQEVVSDFIDMFITAEQNLKTSFCTETVEISCMVFKHPSMSFFCFQQFSLDKHRIDVSTTFAVDRYLILFNKRHHIGKCFLHFLCSQQFCLPCTICFTVIDHTAIHTDNKIKIETKAPCCTEFLLSFFNDSTRCQSEHDTVFVKNLECLHSCLWQISTFGSQRHINICRNSFYIFNHVIHLPFQNFINHTTY